MTEDGSKKYSIALAGNPNVGKSTVFNALTGMKQHTGNWAGKTVGCAYGEYEYSGCSFRMIDLPGCYSVSSETGEERIAGEFLCFGGADAAVTVCDATCLERNLILALQVAELNPKTVICVNLMDEAKKKGIVVDTGKLSEMTGLTVIGASARSGKGLDELKQAIKFTAEGETPAFKHFFGKKTEASINKLTPLLEKYAKKLSVSERFLALGLLEEDPYVMSSALEGGCDLMSDGELSGALNTEKQRLLELGLDKVKIREGVFLSVIKRSEELASSCVHTVKHSAYTERLRRLDRIFTGKLTAYPIMAMLLALILWITVVGANYPSELLSKGFLFLGDSLYGFLIYIHTPVFIADMLVNGVYRVLSWVVSVMLPPMAIFFPLFTILEDLGYLPRIAFNLDSAFKKCHACGKQALTMCMGFGCNAVGVTGCRIIDSKRERLIAVLTNVFVPCNGRFPTLITLITLFIITGHGILHGFLSALILTLVILFGVFLTFAVSFFLSKTILKGMPSAFTLELPPYRTPQFGKVIVRSVFDRTLFVLGRAVSVAAPAGLIIWLMANLTFSGVPLIGHISSFLDPFAKVMGLDGVILIAFILGFPANETVIPIMIMAYTQGSALANTDASSLGTILLSNGWTVETAVCTMIFCLCHFPCSTTLITVYKETKSKTITLLSAVLPTVIGVILCMLTHFLFLLIGTF